MKTWWILLFSTSVWATPYPIESELLPTKTYPRELKHAQATQELAPAQAALRVQVDWQSAGETYRVARLVKEMSGTPALEERATKRDAYGSYQAELKVGATSYFASIGTGKEYRKLVPSLTFRFPWPQVQSAELIVWAENPLSGVREKVLNEIVTLSEATTAVPAAVETKLLQAATAPHPVVMAIYAEGFELASKERFFQRAQRVVDELEKARFPGRERFHYLAVFAASKEKLGTPRDRGANPVKRDSFLGLYFPHWNQFGRWYHVVYPTNENQFRESLASVAYDYPLALVDDASYWGVGNYLVHTAIPAEASSFSFLLLHEFGHFLGLNEEYEDDGRTELEHAPDIDEPWSPNITFHPQRGELKWEQFVKAETPLPTPRDYGGWVGKTVGAFVGGYAGSAPVGKTYKPAKSCIMNTGGEFCPVCTDAIKKQLAKDSGE